MAKDKDKTKTVDPVIKSITVEATPNPVVPEGAVLLYETDGKRVYQVGNATGDGSEGNTVQRIVVNVREIEEA